MKEQLDPAGQHASAPTRNLRRLVRKAIIQNYELSSSASDSRQVPSERAGTKQVHSYGKGAPITLAVSRVNSGNADKAPNSEYRAHLLGP